MISGALNTISPEMAFPLVIRNRVHSPHSQPTELPTESRKIYRRAPFLVLLLSVRIPPGEFLIFSRQDGDDK